MSFNIILINPPYKRGKGFNREGRCTQEASFWSTPWPPYSLASIAAVIREKNKVKILDCPAQNINRKKLENIINKNKPDIVISSISTQTVDADLEILEKIKCENKAIVIIFGIHATVFAEEIIKTCLVDFVVRNEPEETVKELIQALANREDLRQIKGIAYKSDSKKVVLTEKREFIKNLDSLPFPAWDLVDLNKYRLPFYGRKFIIINNLRGCPFHCSFCNAQVYYGFSVRTRSVQNIMKEIKHSIDKYQIRDIFFWADTFTLIKEKTKSFCENIINENLEIKWVANSRIDTVDQELLLLMKRAGCWLISYGIESGDDNILMRCGKNINQEKIIKAVSMARSIGIKTAGHFIFGLPDETEDSARKTLDLVKRLDLDFVNFYSAVPYPGSPLYEEALQSGLIKEKRWEQFNQSEFVMDLPSISKEQLYKIKKNAYYSFYFSPKSIKTAFSLISIKSWVFNLVSSAKRRRHKVL